MGSGRAMGTTQTFSWEWWGGPRLGGGPLWELVVRPIARASEASGRAEAAARRPIRRLRWRRWGG